VKRVHNVQAWKPDQVRTNPSLYRPRWSIWTCPYMYIVLE